MRLPPGTKVYSAHLNGTQGGHDKTTVWHLMMGYIQIIVSFESFIASHPSQRPPLRPKSWCFTFAHGERWELLEPPIHPREDPQSNFRRLNLKSRLHPSRLHIWLSRCLQDGLLYCLNSCVASNAANLCHHADLLLSVHATAGAYPSEMNAGAFWVFLCSPNTRFAFSLSQSNCRAEELRENLCRSLDTDWNESSLLFSASLKVKAIESSKT